MGLEIEREDFSDDEHRRFAERLRASIEVLAEVLARPGFGDGPATLGAELEFSLIDDGLRPAPCNRAVLDEAAQPHLTLECDRFQLECTTAPVALAGRPFSALRADLERTLAAAGAVAARHAARIATIGILPTLAEHDLQSGALTDSARYRALSAGLRRLRGAPFEFRIAGRDEALAIDCEDVTFEGATTSWQVHLKTPLDGFRAIYNAAQIATAPVLAIAGNSPLFLGRRLWDETRIALFRQAVDERADADPDDWRPARVSFGHGFARRGALELFAESVALHPALIPVLADEDPRVAARGGVPALAELRLHQGTIWRWNRPVYDPADGGHVRLEMRALPCGPTMTDMLANAAFLTGLVLALAADVERLLHAITFGQARRNFYAAARGGIDAEILWPAIEAPSPRPVPALELVPRLLPLAYDALVAHGVAADEARALLTVIERRVAARTSGARWQARVLAERGRTTSRREAIDAMFARYLELSASGAPVHEWPAS
jgi:gamma-glutamyl:cysteine ligase YbdK (ATP-grasp superfamily)